MRQGKVFLYIAVLLSFVIFTPSAHAFRFNIDKPKIVLEIKPGEKAVGQVTVDTYGYNQDLTVRVYVQDLIYLPDGTNDFIPKGSTEWSLGDWIKVEPREFVLKANTSQPVRYAIRVPVDAEGGRYGVVFFEAILPRDPMATTTSSARIGSIFAVTAKGTDTYEADLMRLQASYDEEGAFVAECVVRNNGNALIRVCGDFAIMDMEGNKIAGKETDPLGGGGTLPQTSRSFKVAWESGELLLEEGKDYILQVTVDYGGENILGGQTYFRPISNE